jgi:signal transduction histidine kinase
MRLIIVAAAAIGLILFVAFVVARLLRTRTRGMSIRMQVFLALGLIVGTFAFGLGLMVIDRIEARAVMIATQAAEDEAAALAGMMAGEIDRSGVSVRVIADQLLQEHKRGADLRLELLDAQGTRLFPQDLQPARRASGVVRVDAPIIVHGERLGAVRVVKPTIVMQNLLADFAPTVLVISLILGTASALAAAWIGREIAAPIEALSQFGERVSAGERTAAAPVAQGREVMRLARSIDSMRRQLEGRPFVETFASDLSHELKNPVAAIRASAEVLEESALEDSKEARRFVSRIREATVRIERLLGELLSLARIESRGTESFEPVDLAELARHAVESTADPESRLSFTAEGDARVRGERIWLARAVSNLIDNALVHSTVGAVEVVLRREADTVTLTVASPGAVTKHVRTQLFRRFVTTRADKGGTGLGLSIVRAVAEAHGGYAELVEPGPPRVVFRLTLPPAHRSTASRLRDAVADARGQLVGDSSLEDRS